MFRIKKLNDFNISIPYIIGVFACYNFVVFKLFFLRISIEHTGAYIRSDRFISIADCGICISFNKFAVHLFQTLYKC